MDEAERCNTLAYIVYGRMMATGTIPEIIKESGLHTWVAHGKGLVELSNEIKSQPGVEQVVPWGNELRVSGTDQAALHSAVEHYPQYDWEETRTGLEEVFVHFVAERAEEGAL
jgi:ABC-2 type transport system ATP-binding protein